LYPILIEIQRIVDLKFLQCVISCCLSIIKTHSKISIVIIFYIHTIRSEARKDTAPSSTFSYLSEYPCTDWANACYIMDAKSIQNHSHHRPLNPFVAIGSFFFEGVKKKPSLLSIKEREDEAIQLLYRVAKKFF
ncbi:MAG: hypothetical protein EXX96DRAFT_491612, partial [Benjaminiella poitrasii]